MASLIIYSVCILYFTTVIVTEKCSNPKGGLEFCSCSADETIVTCRNNSMLFFPTKLPLNVETFIFESKSLQNIPPSYFQSYIRLKSIQITGGVFPDLYQQYFNGISRTVMHLKISETNLRYITQNTFYYLSQLTSLELQNNDFISFPIQLQMENLTHLDLSGNKISSIGKDVFSKLRNLEMLKLNNNKLTSLPSNLFRNLVSLKKLYVSNNQLSNLSSDIFLSLRYLTELYITDNKLDNAFWEALKKLKNVQKLGLSRNQFSSVEANNFLHMGDLQSIFLRENRLPLVIKSKAFFIDQSNVRELYLSGNNITQITNFTFFGLQNLTTLYLDDNRLKEIPTDAFLHLSKLEWLHLRRNQLTSIDIDGFRGLKQIKHIYLTSNLLKNMNKVFQHSKSLVQLNLNDNRIEHITKTLFEGLEKLKYLNLDNNTISDIYGGAFIKLPSLEKLYLRHNKLTKIDEDDFAHATFKELYLSYNHLDIKTKAFQDIRNLKKLYLSDNRMTSVKATMFQNTKLELLNLQRNRISFVESLPDSVKINISHNQLDYLSSEMFSRNIEILDASYNNISALKKSTFQNVFSLRSLYLQHNRIDTLEENTFCRQLLCEYSLINFENNLLPCNCKIWSVLSPISIIIIRGSCPSMSLTDLVEKNGCQCGTSDSGKCNTKKRICEDHKCKNNAECIALNENSYICKCNGGYHGRTCQLKSSECNPKLCNNNGTCQRIGKKATEYTCLCNTGFSGKNCAVKTLTNVEITSIMISGLVIEAIVCIVFVIAVVFLFQRVKTYRTLSKKPSPADENQYASIDTLYLPESFPTYQPLSKMESTTAESPDANEYELNLEMQGESGKEVGITVKQISVFFILFV
ncbi:insulin-like growth factor-binding protein complex acid labile subunit isoform X2 [Hydractinia symbiolongicarpus]|uniref:insulin-like growth factor-binding protein complex acid labile subunit isoform X2 n=1 Tax=Hydractinia symbiolongicarpus TaxID=13093 RepID=UPI00254A3D3E|nr:insulin-like growth factor-binding protein complex acid labile subunit isoform X2 [Hydractinia symbiolongicarpus]